MLKTGGTSCTCNFPACTNRIRVSSSWHNRPFFDCNVATTATAAVTLPTGTRMFTAAATAAYRDYQSFIVLNIGRGYPFT